jgi:hypothetical protein
LDTSGLRNEEHFGYLSLVDAEFKKCNSPLFTSPYAGFLNGLNAYDAALERSRGSFLTRPLAEADARRDAAYRGLAERVHAGTRHFNPERANEARQVEVILSRYGNPVSLPYIQENGVMLNLVQDLDKPAWRARLATLDAEEWLDELKTSNDEFISLFSTRNEEQAGTMTGLAREARLVATRAYQACVTRLNALAEVEGPDAYAPVIAAVNRLVEYQKNVLRARFARGGRTGETENDEQEPGV